VCAEIRQPFPSQNFHFTSIRNPILRSRAAHFGLARISLLIALVQPAVRAQTVVQDIFGRTLNQHGLTLVDWDGYLANPLIRFYLVPPTNAALPASATLTVNGARLYFDLPSGVGPNGPSSGTGASRLARILCLGAIGQKQVVEASTDLLVWTPLLTNVLATTSFQFTETNTFQHPQRFYRTRAEP
jgi:hypothetical protein